MARSGRSHPQGGRRAGSRPTWSPCLVWYPCAWDTRPAATAASIRSSSAFLSALSRAFGWIPSCFAASSTIAALSAREEEPSSVAAIAAPPPATVAAATVPATSLRLSERSIDGSFLSADADEAAERPSPLPAHGRESGFGGRFRNAARERLP